jgi:Dihydroxybiphenyl dioxygenase BphC D1
VNASDLGAWKKFANDVLGFAIAPDSGDQLLSLRGGERHHRLIIHSGDSYDVAYVGWERANHEALEATASLLEKQGVKVQAGKTGELADRRLLERASFTCPYSDVRMELSNGWGHAGSVHSRRVGLSYTAQLIFPHAPFRCSIGNRRGSTQAHAHRAPILALRRICVDRSPPQSRSAQYSR